MILAIKWESKSKSKSEFIQRSVWWELRSITCWLPLWSFPAQCLAYHQPGPINIEELLQYPIQISLWIWFLKSWLISMTCTQNWWNTLTNMTCDEYLKDILTNMTCAKMAIPTPPLGDLTYKSQRKLNGASLSPRSLQYGDRTGQVRLPEKGKGHSS